MIYIIQNYPRAQSEYYFGVPYDSNLVRFLELSLGWTKLDKNWLDKIKLKWLVVKIAAVHYRLSYFFPQSYNLSL